ncbi:MAG: 16S rRNA (guanine(527)-N(7))-methyltransferase RsmG [Acidimicrobiales bacterium]
MRRSSSSTPHRPTTTPEDVFGGRLEVAPLSETTLLALAGTLTEAREFGFLGAPLVEEQIDHSLGFVEIITRLEGAGAPRPSLVDLGSGGGVPGLVLALSLPDHEVTLLDASARRAAWLSQAVRRLGLADTVNVVCRRAEELGRLSSYRASFSLVTARGFGPPAVVAECAGPLLRPGGHLIVSEPPEQSAGFRAPAPNHEGGIQEESPRGLPSTESRWPPAGLAEFGFSPAVKTVARGRSYVALTSDHLCPAAYPRRVGIPEKRQCF